MIRKPRGRGKEHVSLEKSQTMPTPINEGCVGYLVLGAMRSGTIITHPKEMEPTTKRVPEVPDASNSLECPSKAASRLHLSEIQTLKEQTTIK